MAECEDNTYLFSVTCIDRPGRMVPLQGTFHMIASPVTENENRALIHSTEIKKLVEESDSFKVDITMNNEIQMDITTQSIKLVELSLDTEEMIIRVIPNPTFA